MKKYEFDKGRVVVIPPDEAETYGGKVKLVNMKKSQYRVMESFNREVKKVKSVTRSDADKK